MKRHVESKIRTLPKDSPALPFYRKLNSKAIFVDNFHASNHVETDTFCQQNTQPSLFPHLSTFSDSEAVEQLNSWWR